MSLSKRPAIFFLGSVAAAALLVGIYLHRESGDPASKLNPMASAPEGARNEEKKPPAVGEVATPHRPVERLEQEVPQVPVRVDAGRWNLQLASIDANFDLGLGKEGSQQDEPAGADKTSSGSAGSRAGRSAFSPGGGGGGGGGGVFFVPPSGTNNNNNGPLPNVVVVGGDNQPDPQTNDPRFPEIPPTTTLVGDFGPNVPGGGDGGIVIPLTDPPAGKNDSDNPIVGLPVVGVNVPDRTTDPLPVAKVPDGTSGLGMLLISLPVLVALRRRITR